jgi:hypothetical protein
VEPPVDLDALPSDLEDKSIITFNATVCKNIPEPGGYWKKYECSYSDLLSQVHTQWTDG